MDVVQKHNICTNFEKNMSHKNYVSSARSELIKALVCSDYRIITGFQITIPIFYYNYLVKRFIGAIYIVQTRTGTRGRRLHAGLGASVYRVTSFHRPESQVQ
jgi:hypothetical protein